IFVHLGVRSILVLFEQVEMGEDGVQLNSYDKNFLQTGQRHLSDRSSLFGSSFSPDFFSASPGWKVFVFQQKPPFCLGAI
ncbi:MAG: hypothetical protein KAJ60_03300, partial [Desulfobulbaceae bacterium]|nr:hypothetical protein [Desulfobulbaceae bacterium]